MKAETAPRSSKSEALICWEFDMWEPFRKGLEQRAPQCKIVYDKFHVVKHANGAIDEVRRAEFFWQGPQKRGLIQIK